MTGIKDSAKDVFKRIDNAIGNYVPHSDVESALSNIREGRTQYSADTKTSVKSNKGDKSVLIGIGAGSIEAAGTLPLLIKANNLSLNVIRQGDKLYRISPWGELDLFEKAVYPLVDQKICGGLPLTTALWAGSAIVTGLVVAGTYYLAHRKLKE